MDRPAYLAHLQADIQRVVAAIDRGPVTAPVSSCPGWDLTALVGHLGFVHRWATTAVTTAERPGTVAGAQPGDEDLAAWFLSGAANLVRALDTVALDAPTWHPFPFEQRAWVWVRRQAHETAVHRWDAEMAVVGASTLDPELAADGITEYLELALPRVLTREKVDAPRSTLALERIDGTGRWVISNTTGTYGVADATTTADATLTGPAGDLLLLLMGRAPRAVADVSGDAAVADAWLALPGL